MGRGAYAGQVAQQPDIARMVGELVGAEQAAIRRAAELRIFLRIDFPEDGALVPHLAFIVFQRIGKLILGDVHHPDFQLHVGFGIVDQIPEAAPGALHLPHFRAMQDLVHLLAQHLVDAGDQRLDRLDRVGRNRRRFRPRLRGERQVPHKLLQPLAVVLLDLEVLLEKFAELVEVYGLGASFGDCG